MKNKINFKKWIRPTMVLTSSISAVAFSAFSIVQKNQKNSSQELSYSQKTMKALSNSFLNNFNNVSHPASSPIPENEAPVDLYLLPILEKLLTDPQTSSAKLTAVIDGLNQLGLFSDNVNSAYDGLGDLFAYSASQSNAFKSKAQTAESKFITAEVKDNVDVINSISTNVPKDKDLIIYRPKKAFSIYNVGAAKNITAAKVASDVTSQIPADFSYQVASIDMGGITNDSFVAFDYKDDLDSSADNYRLYVSNANGQLKNAITKKMTMQEMIDKKYLFIRNLNSKTSTTSKTVTSSKLSNILKFSKSSAGDHINIFVTPSSKHIDNSSAIHFGLSKKTDPKDPKKKINVTDSKSIGAVKYGFIDYTLSPLHLNKQNTQGTAFTKTNLLNQNEPILPKTGIVDSIEVNSILQKWDLVNAYQSNGKQKVGNHNTLFMLPNTNISQNLSFVGQGSNAFSSSNNAFEINYDGGNAVIKPVLQKFKITENAMIKTIKKNPSLKGNIEPILYYDQKINVGTTNPIDWLQVDLSLPKGVIQWNPDKLGKEQDFILDEKLWDKGIFFEPPQGGTQAINKNNLREFEIEQQTAVSDQNLQFIADVYANWEHKFQPSDKDVYLRPDVTSFPNNYSRANLLNYYDPKNPNDPKNNSNTSLMKMYKNDPDAKGFGIFPIEYYIYEESNEKLQNRGWYTDIVKQNQDGKVLKNTDGTDKAIPSTGWNIMNKLNDYSNMLARWSVEKLGANANSVRTSDFYKLNNAGDSRGALQKRILDQSGAVGEKLQLHADALTKFWMSGTPTPEQSNYLLDLKQKFTNGEVKWDIGQIQDKAKPLGASSQINKYKGYEDDLQIVYHFIEIDFAEAVKQLFLLEKQNFENLKGGVLGEAIKLFLGNGISGQGINKNIVHKIDNSQLGSYFKNSGLLALDNNQSIKVSSGKELLQSLLDFIVDNGLENTYLSNSEAVDFDNLYNQGQFTNMKLYADKSRQATVLSMVNLLDTIIRGIAPENGSTKTLYDIIDGILGHSISKKDAPNEIKISVQNAINRIIDKSKNTISYIFFNGKTTSSYIENLVIGKNLSIIIDKYLQKHGQKGDRKLTLEQESILTEKRGKAIYDPKTITQLGVNLKYYHLQKFINELTQEKYIPSTAAEILESDLGKNFQIEIPTSNNFVDFLSDPSLMIQYSTLFSGIILSFVSGVATLMLFKKQKNSSSATMSGAQSKSKLIFKIIFSVIFIVGIAIIGLSFGLPGLANGI